MVLKSLAFLVLTFLTGVSYAQTALTLQQAYQLATQGKCQDTISVLKGQYGLFSKSRKVNETVLELGAVCLEKMGQYKSALTLHYQILNSVHFKNHNLIMQNYKKNQSADDVDEVPAKLAKIYFRIGRIYSTFILSKRSISPKDYTISFNQSKKYLALAILGEHEEDSAEKILKLLDKEEEDKNKLVYQSSWHASLGYMNWQDQVFLAGPSGRTPLTATTEGLCIGGGYEQANAYWGWKVSACYASAKSNVGDNIPNDFDYYQEGVPVNALAISSGVFMPLSTGNTSIGLELPIFLRTGNYTDPSNTAFSIEQKTMLAIGVAVDAKWRINQFGLSSKIAKIFSLPSLAWTLEGHYHF